MFCSKCGCPTPDNTPVCANCANSSAAPTSTQAVIPHTYLIPSILVTLFCCLPLGVVSILYAVKVSGFVTKGQIAEAQIASQKAKKWMLTAFFIGIVVNILGIIVQVIGAIA